jgi:excisionase family DNA binding protein
MDAVSTPTATDRQLLLDAAEVAQMLRIARSTFFTLVSAGRIGPRPVRLGRRCLYRRTEVEVWIEQGCPPLSRWKYE